MAGQPHPRVPISLSGGRNTSLSGDRNPHQRALAWAAGVPDAPTAALLTSENEKAKAHDRN